MWTIALYLLTGPGAQSPVLLSAKSLKEPDAVVVPHRGESRAEYSQGYYCL